MLDGNKTASETEPKGVIGLTLKEYKWRAVVVVSQGTKNDEELELEHQTRTGTYEIDKRKKIENQMLCKSEAFFASKWIMFRLKMNNKLGPRGTKNHATSSSKIHATFPLYTITKHIYVEVFIQTN